MRACFCQLLDIFFYKNLSKLHCSPSTKFAFAPNSPALILFPEISCNYPHSPHTRIKFASKLFSRAKIFKLLNSVFYLSVIAIDLALA